MSAAAIGFVATLRAMRSAIIAASFGSATAQRIRTLFVGCLVQHSLLTQVPDEPLGRKACDLFERSRFFEKMCRTGNDLHFLFAV